MQLEKSINVAETILKAIVNEPGKLGVKAEVDSEGTNVLRISAEPSDYGRIIGKKGKVINALKTILLTISTNADSGKVKWSIEVPKKE